MHRFFKRFYFGNYHLSILPMKIQRVKGKPREESRRHYTTRMRKGKRVMVARIPKGQKGAGRLAKSALKYSRHPLLSD